MTLCQIHDAATSREAGLLAALSQSHKSKDFTLNNQCERLHTSRACLESAAHRTEAAFQSQGDVQLLVARSDMALLSALPAQPLVPQADDVLAFIMDHSKLLGMLSRVGAVSDNRNTCAAKTTASAHHSHHRPFEAWLLITARDEQGQRRVEGGDSFVVELEDFKGELAVTVEDRGDGSYGVKCVLPAEAVGDLKLAVSVHGSPIQGSPFLLRAVPQEIRTALFCLVQRH